MAACSSSDFWDRVGLQEEDKTAYVEAIRCAYPGREVLEFEHQGYCSFTLVVRPWEFTPDFSGSGRCEDDVQTGTDALIVQLRPPQHALSLTITDAAAKIYRGVAPGTIQLLHSIHDGFLTYEMPMLPGKPLSLLQPQVQSPGVEIYNKQTTLIKSLTILLAKSWPNAQEPRRSIRADSPISPFPPTILSHCPGKVGRFIVPKLQALARSLPDAALQQRAQSVLDALKSIPSYPVVLTHGDLIPSNILVHEPTWRITGLVDWAEAEYLPFGTCLYALEHLLGYMPSASEFVYFESAPRLRELFWTCLVEAVPELETRRGEVRVMRDLGVLLWHGFAWDGGRIDRVVEEGRDEGEVVRLRAFLGVD